MLSQCTAHSIYRRVYALCLVLGLVAVSAMGTAAQTSELDEKIVIAFAPQYPMPDLLTENFFHPFEEAHPGVDVVVVDPPEFRFWPGADGIDPLDYIASFASTADVFAVDGNLLTPIETRAGLVMDLQPFINNDEELNLAETFYPKVIDAYKWDGGNWALPASWTLGLMGYHPGTFDDANLPQPHPVWSWDTFADTMQALEEATDSAPLSRQHLLNPTYVVLSLAGVPLVDSDMMPQFDREELLDAWKLWDSAREASWMVKPEDHDYNEAYPAVLTNYHLSGSGNAREYTHAPLPGGHTILETQGFAISSGTTHPEISYALTKYLSRQLELVGGWGSNLPARQDICNQADGRFRFDNIDTVRKDFEKLLPFAMNPRDIQFTRYLYTSPLEEEQEDIEQRLLDAQQQVLDDLTMAEQYDAQITIEKPKSDYAPVHGDTIRFGLASGYWWRTEMPLKDFAADYVRDHPTVGRIDISSRSGSANILVESYDCFWGDQRSLAEMPISSIMRLEPLTEADSNFDLESFIPAALEKAQYQDVLWGYPLSLHPLALRYNSTVFADNNIALPSTEWDADDFDSTMRALCEHSEDDAAVLGRPRSYGSAYLQILTAAYGGMPVDLRTDPSSYDLTAPENVEAIRQVLDLARAGIMDYQALSSNSFSFNLPGEPVIFPDSHDQDLDPKYKTYELVSFPQTHEHEFLAYSVGMGYISAKTPLAEACYDWISALAQRPDLFNGLPARTDLPNRDDVTTAIAANGPGFFADYVAQLNSERAFVFPQWDPWYDEGRWLNQAFDRYVLDDVPLESALESAERKLKSYRECVGEYPYVSLL